MPSLLMTMSYWGADGIRPLAIVHATESPMNVTRSGPSGGAGTAGAVTGTGIGPGTGAGGAVAGGDVGGGVVTSAGCSTGLGWPMTGATAWARAARDGRLGTGAAPVPAAAARVRSKTARMPTMAIPSLARLSHGRVSLSNTTPQDTGTTPRSVASRVA